MSSRTVDATCSRWSFLALVTSSLFLLGCPQVFDLEVAAAPDNVVAFQLPPDVLISDFEIQARLPAPEDASGNRVVAVHWSFRARGADSRAGGRPVREIRFGELPRGFAEEVPPIPLVPGAYYEATVGSTNRGMGRVVFRVVDLGGSLRVEKPFGRWVLGPPRQPEGLVPAALLADARDRGDAEAQYRVGLAYLDGDGVWRDEKEAYSWFLNAARQGHAKAQHQVALLGVYTFAGLSREDAFEWSMKSAVQGWPPAQVEVGLCYNLGLGVARDEQAGATWLRRAAEAGNARGMNYLAGALARGEGVPLDEDEALHWQRKAASGGDR